MIHLEGDGEGREDENEEEEEELNLEHEFEEKKSCVQYVSCKLSLLLPLLSCYRCRRPHLCMLQCCY